MTEDEYRDLIRAIENKAQAELDRVYAEARTRVHILQSRKVRYSYLFEAIVGMLADPARDKIEAELKRQGEAISEQYYRELDEC